MSDDGTLALLLMGCRWSKGHHRLGLGWRGLGLFPLLLLLLLHWVWMLLLLLLLLLLLHHL